MPKLPYFAFYPADWRKDPGVQSLTFHDRGVWFEMLCLMHESDQRGKLMLNGKPMPLESLARLLGLEQQVLTNTLTTLLDSGVASRCPRTGALVCRRMVRDEAARAKWKSSGRSGGNPALIQNYNVPGFVYLMQRASDGAVKIGISTNPTNRLYKVRYANQTESIELLGIERVEDMGKAESGYHEQYKAFCLDSGEWFKIPASELFTLKGKFKGKVDIPPKGKLEDECVFENSSPLGRGDTGETYHRESRTVLHILIEATGRHFRETDANLEVISARLREPGVDLEGVRKMIARQCARWKGTTQEEFLRPETLFGKTKFDSYYAAGDLPISTDQPGAKPKQESLIDKQIKSLCSPQ